MPDTVWSLPRDRAPGSPAPLHPEAAALLGPSGAAPTFPTEVFTDPAAAQAYLAAARSSYLRETEVVEAVADVEDRTLPSGRTVRLYRPDVAGRRPIFLFMHGGGWVLGNLDMHDEFCRRLANLAGVTVASVDYRLAPEHPFPAGLDDCLEALDWVRAEADSFGSDGGRVAVGGTSAGGNLAAAVVLANRARGGPALSMQVLVYPVLDARMATTSYATYGEGPGLQATQMRWFWDLYAPDPATRRDPLLSPALEPDLAGLPPALLFPAECDPLRDEAVEYARRLHDAGVEVHLEVVAGQLHSFFRHLDVLSDANRVLSEIAGRLRTVFAGPVSAEASA